MWGVFSNQPLIVAACFAVLAIFSTFSIQAEEGAAQKNTEVMQAFTSQEQLKNDITAVDDQTKRVVMFVMGVPLLLLLLITGVLGIAMGVYGKQVFVAHMVCAGLSITLAIAHAVVGIVWFYPF